MSRRSSLARGCRSGLCRIPLGVVEGHYGPPCWPWRRTWRLRPAAGILARRGSLVRGHGDAGRLARRSLPSSSAASPSFLHPCFRSPLSSFLPLCHLPLLYFPIVSYLSAANSSPTDGLLGPRPPIAPFSRLPPLSCTPFATGCRAVSLISLKWSRSHDHHGEAGAPAPSAGPPPGRGLWRTIAWFFLVITC